MIKLYFCKKLDMKTAVEIRKLNLIEEFLNLNNEDIIKKIEDLLKEECLKFLEQELKRPYSSEDFNAMIDNAEKDAAEGKVMSSAQLKQQINTWK
jgi:hypothetical protein